MSYVDLGKAGQPAPKEDPKAKTGGKVGRRLDSRPVKKKTPTTTTTTTTTTIDPSGWTTDPVVDIDDPPVEDEGDDPISPPTEETPSAFPTGLALLAAVAAVFAWKKWK